MTVRARKYGPLLHLLNQLCRLSMVFRMSFTNVNGDSIIAAAKRKTGLSDFGSDRYIEPLGKVLDEAIAAGFTPFARAFIRGAADRSARARLLREALFAAHPEILDVPIERPLFVVGFPRTGTTVLQNLLSCEPGSRALPFWELTNPLPLHPDPERDLKKRIKNARRDLKLAYFAAPELAVVHDVRPETPEECWALFGPSFSVLNWDLAHGIERYGDWLLEQPLEWAYREYRSLLQVLLTRKGASTLVLKCPEHLWFLDDLLAVFPDACIVWTHRDPLPTVASYCSMVSLSRRINFGGFEPVALGAHITNRFDQGVTRAMAVRDGADPARFFDVRFHELHEDPIAVVRRIREYFDLPFTDEGKAAVEANLAAKRRDKPGSHRYSPAMYGLDGTAVRARFATYIERFGIQVGD